MQTLEIEHLTPPESARPARWREAFATAACAAVVILAPKTFPAAIRITFVLLGTVGALDLSRRETPAPGDPRPIVSAIAALFALAVLATPKLATDIWSYTMVGRVLFTHHLNPYRVAPAAVSSDPMLHFVHRTWRYGTTPYGPVSVLHAALVAAVAGTHPLLYRLAFQATAALSIGVALWLLWRATHSTAALALVGLHPEIAGSIVNGGHNDAVIALGLLALVLLLTSGRIRAAGWILLLAVLTKLTIVFAIIPVAVWTWARYGRRAVWRLLAPLLVIGPLMALIPGAVTSMTRANGGIVTRLAVWNVPLHVGWLAITHLHAANYTTVGLLTVLAVTGFAAWRERDQPDPSIAAATGVAVWVALSAYVLPWYTALGLVVAALHPTRRLTRWLAVQGGVITAAFLIPRPLLRTNHLLGQTVHVYVPLALTAAFVWALLERRVRVTRDAVSATAPAMLPTRFRTARRA